MSTDSFRRHTRGCVDAAIHRALAQLSHPARAAFMRLLAVVRARSPFLHAPPVQNRVTQIDALCHLARVSADYLVEPETWPGAAGIRWRWSTPWRATCWSDIRCRGFSPRRGWPPTHSLHASTGAGSSRSGAARGFATWVRSMLTIEIDPRSGTIVQVRGFANRRASGPPLELVRGWAAREKLSWAITA